MRDRIADRKTDATFGGENLKQILQDVANA